MPRHAQRFDQRPDIQRDVIRQLEHAIRTHDDAVAEAATAAAEADEAAGRAGVFGADAARVAGAAGEGGLDGDVLADVQGGDAGAELCDDAGELVAEGYGERAVG